MSLHRPTARSIRVLAWTASLLYAAPCWAGEWVVDDDGGPGVDFTQIQPAIDAAADGDTIWIRPGDYASFQVTAKALTLSGDAPGAVVVRGANSVSQTPPGFGVQLENLSFKTTGFQDSLEPLVLQFNVGPVWLYDCAITAASPGCYTPGQVAVTVTASQQVGLVRCQVQGANGGAGCSDGAFGSYGAFGRAGVRVEDADVQFFECDVRGGSGGDGFAYDDEGGEGAEGAICLGDSTVFFSRSTFEGGQGGDAGGSCRSGVLLLGPATARAFESSFDTPNCPLPPIDPPQADSTRLCFGTTGPCPCGTFGTSGAGCPNSYGAAGDLSLTGNASLGADTLTLRHSGVGAGKTILFFQGAQELASAAPLGDGLRCAGGSVLRLATRTSSGATDSFGAAVPGDPSVSVAGQVPVLGATRVYQVWYRDPNAACGAGNFNLSNALLVRWRP